VRIIKAEEAAKLVENGDTLRIGGSGAGHSVPDALIAAIGKRFLADGEPRDLTRASGGPGRPRPAWHRPSGASRAARRTAGLVIVPVKRLALHGTLPPKQVKIPACWWTSS
jgi:acyl CoA:acetate/3-ketoacid CoA transferase